MPVEQLPLFPQQGIKGQYGPPVAETSSLSKGSSLSAAIGGFHDYMIREGFTENTIKAFLGDLRILTRYLGAGRPIGQIGTKDLNDFLTYLLHYRGVPCNPKSYSRRVTTLKVFFGWLAEADIIPYDPAAPLIHQRVSTPLPQILYDSQIEEILKVTQRLRRAEQPDARPHLLIMLVLQTGIKKGECMAIKLSHIDLSDPVAPVLYIRYANPKMRHKERKLSLPADFPTLLEEYIAQYYPKENLFECTARNLEYVLHNVAQLAGLADGISFEALRWTCAVQEYKAEMPSEKLRQKLGLSRISWRETSDKIAKLASPAL
jgi:site-specific recombinase XerD